jgi:hypothetical protein
MFVKINLKNKLSFLKVCSKLNIIAGKIYSGGTGTAVRVYVQATEPTGASVGDLWFWGS